MDDVSLKRFAAAGILAEIARLNALLEELTSSTRATPSGQQGRKRRRRHMSAAARKRMSEMMKARWAARRAKRR